MHWEDVVITDKSEKDHKGYAALQFIEKECKPISLSTRSSGAIVINPYTPAESTEDKDVRKFLLYKLVGKAKSVRFWTKDNPQRAVLPLARGDMNLLIVNPTRLKVEFLIKQEPASGAKKYLKDPGVWVTAAFAGNRHVDPWTKRQEVRDGVVDFGLVPTGKYRLTPDFSGLEPCKYDFNSNPLTIDLNPGDDITVTLEVELLYQKVQLLAHCLLSIYDRTFEFDAVKDKGKASATVSDGKRTIELKKKTIIERLYNASDLTPALPAEKAEFVDDETLEFKAKSLPNEYWKQSDLDKDTLAPDKIEIVGQLGSDPDIYQVKFKPKYIEGPEFYKMEELAGEWKGRYHGKLKDKDDMDARVNLLKATVEFAYTKAKDDPTVLKVFMIPECYFQGRYGSYLVEEADHLFSHLLNLVGDVKWRDWMFVFGTVNLIFGKEVSEMMNYSPVVRGGLGAAAEATGTGGETDTHFRLIQKLVNSAELMSADEVINNEEGETRKPSVNEAIQFQATQNEEEVGQILSRIFDETSYTDGWEKKPGWDIKDLEYGKDKGFSEVQWNGLKEALKQDVKAQGLARVVRAIRNCNIDKTSNTLSDWAFSGFKDKSTTHLTTNQVFLITENPSQKILNFVFRQEWDKYWTGQLKGANRPQISTANWNHPADLIPRLKLRAADFKSQQLDNVANRQKTIIDNVKKFFSDINCLKYQKDTLEQELSLENLLLNPAGFPAWLTGRVPYFDDGQPLTNSLCFSPYPMWKKLLELYYKEKARDISLLKQVNTTMNPGDYCFAMRRKAGPWIKLDEAKDLDPCKKLVFGLEICADHAAGRLMNIVQEPIPDYVELVKKTIPDADKLTPEEIIQEQEKIDKEYKLLAERKKIEYETKVKGIKTKNDNKAKITIDIQLIPSAGMFPTQNYIVARKDGYVFNCDGWNKGEVFGVNFIKYLFEGVEAKNVSPVYPHTAIGKGGGGSLEMNTFSFTPFELKDAIDPTLGKDILNKFGLGQLHVYNELELPKN